MTPPPHRLLLDLAVQSPTREKYARAYSEFRDFLRAEGCVPTTSAMWDVALADYCALVYDDNGRTRAGKAHCETVRCALQHFHPALKGRLPVTMRCLHGWDRQHPTASHPPLPRPLLLALAHACTTQHMPMVGVFLVLSFAALLRPGELSRTRVRDLVFPGDPRLATFPPETAAIFLPRSKTGANQLTTFNDPVAIALLRHYRPIWTNPDGLLFPGYTTSVVAGVVARLLQQFGLPARFHLYCLRHGGATYAYMTGEALAAIQLRGRWRTPTTLLSTYLNANKAIVTSTQLPGQVHQLADQVHHRPSCLWAPAR